ncbi:hypothetical protein PCASD_13544, partial [Puccinia coronata f. sp. avenae]
TAPRRRAKKNSIASTVEEIVGISGVDDMSVSQLGDALGEGGSNEPKDTTGGPEEGSDADDPKEAMEAQAQEPDSTAQRKSAAEEKRSKERQETKAKAEAEKTAAMLAGPASYLGQLRIPYPGAWKHGVSHAPPRNAPRDALQVGA